MGLMGLSWTVDFAELGEQGKGSLVGRFDPPSLGKTGPFEASNGLMIGFNNTNSAGIGSNQGQLANQEECITGSDRIGISDSIEFNRIAQRRN